jgi:hypothetical protein
MWTKFGQMAGKAISKIKKPKSLKNKIIGQILTKTLELIKVVLLKTLHLEYVKKVDY